MVYIRVVHSSTRNIDVAEPFVVRLESELEKTVRAVQFREFAKAHPVIQVFYSDGRSYNVLSPEFYKVHSVVYSNNACTTHIVFGAVPNFALLKFQTQFRWESLKLFTVTEAFTLAAAPDVIRTVGKKRKRAEDGVNNTDKTLQEQVAILHDQVALMREEILGYRSLFNDTLLKHVKPTLPGVPLVLPSAVFSPSLDPSVYPSLDPIAIDLDSKDPLFEFMRDAVI